MALAPSMVARHAGHMQGPQRQETADRALALVDEGLEILDDDQCWQLLRTGVVGRVAVSVAALPAIFPVNYSVVDDTIMFCTSPGTKLGAAVRGAVVAFEVDDYDRAARSGWSVQLVGEAHEIVAPSLRARLAVEAHGPWARGDRTHLVQITPAFLTGRRIL